MSRSVQPADGEDRNENTMNVFGRAPIVAWSSSREKMVDLVPILQRKQSFRVLESNVGMRGSKTAKAR